MKNLASFKAEFNPSSISLGKNGDEFRTFPDGTSSYVQNAFPTNEYQQSMGFYDNIIGLIEPIELMKIGNSLSELIEEDIKSQEPFRQATAEIIKLMGLTLNKTNALESASVELFSTTLYETVCHIIASAVDSLLPSQGISKCVIYGSSNDHLEEIAKKIDYFYDHYLNDVLKHFRAEHIKTLFWAIITGACFKKVLIDPVTGKPDSQFIRPSDFIINRDYSSHHNSPRKTHILRLTKREFDIRKHMRFYGEDIEPYYFDSLKDEDDQQIQENLDNISGVENSRSANYSDGGSILWECHCYFLIEGDPLKNKNNLPSPYIITIDSETRKIIRLCRNWKEQYQHREPIDYFIEHNMLPSLDGQGYGLMQYAGGQAEAATAMQRLILKAATYSSFPGGFYSDALRLENNFAVGDPGQFTKLNTGGLKISDVVETYPFKDPSPVYMQLKQEIEDTIRRPSSIINDTVAEMAPRAPTGSVLAVLETLQRVPNMILANFHKSFTYELQLLKERFYEWMGPEDEYPFLVPGGEHVLMKEDFGPQYKVIPSSDPSMQNSAYRLMLSEIILNKANEAPELHDRRAAYEFFYQNLNINPEKIEKILLPKPDNDPKAKDPASENADIINGVPVKVFTFQDDDAHITVHTPLLQNSDPNIAAEAKAHINEHEASKYLKKIQALIGQPIPPDLAQMDPQIQNQFAIMQAQASMQLEQQQQAANPPPSPPIDPGTAQVQAAQIQAQTAQQRLELDGQRLQIEAQNKDRDALIKEKEMEFSQLKNQFEMQVKEKDLQMKEKDMQIKEQSLVFKMQIETLKNDLARIKLEADKASKDDNLKYQIAKADADFQATHLMEPNRVEE